VLRNGAHNNDYYCKVCVALRKHSGNAQIGVIYLLRPSVPADKGNVGEALEKRRAREDSLLERVTTVTIGSLRRDEAPGGVKLPLARIAKKSHYLNLEAAKKKGSQHPSRQAEKPYVNIAHPPGACSHLKTAGRRDLTPLAASYAPSDGLEESHRVVPLAQAFLPRLESLNRLGASAA